MQNSLFTDWLVLKRSVTVVKPRAVRIISIDVICQNFLNEKTFKAIAIVIQQFLLFILSARFELTVCLLKNDFAFIIC